ncbi:MAG TPA: glycosyltransferase 87 family protein [Microlunatus sp.]|nr:glycosyltransferase 87 family protein [Microlunatus sp.]
MSGGELTAGRRAARLAVELVPPFVVALLLLPFIIDRGTFWPWHPSTIDLEVYVYAVRDMLVGNDIFATTTPFWHLYFIYPPIAAVLMTPLAFGPYLIWQVSWTAGLVWAQQSVLRRCRAPRGWRLGLLGIAVVIAVEPIRTTLGYGQVNTILMALVVADLLPDRRDRWKRFPQGVLTGLAASIKLTPALFVVFDFLIGKKKAALWAIIGFFGFTAIGAIFLPQQTWEFWTGLAGGDTRTAGPIYAGNQSLLGVFFRLAGGGGTTLTLVGLGVAGIVALIGAIVAAQWWRGGQKVFAVGIVGICTCLASPLSWTHHYVWVLPLGMAVLVDRLPRWVRVWAGAWVLWICACLPLAVLPYAGGRERFYTPLQQFVANIGPVMGAGLVIALGIRLVLRSLDKVPVPPAPLTTSA